MTNGRDDDALPVGLSDDALALRFAEAHGNRWKFVAAWAQWYAHDGTAWQSDKTLEAVDLARAICREACEDVLCMDHLEPARRERVMKEIRSSRTVMAVQTLARADRRHAATVDQWDADPWLLNTPGGEINLKTGVMQPHRLESFSTKMTAVTPMAGPCPTWHKFLARVTGGDQELIAYLQRLCGYALVGEVVEHVLVFVYGLGANGKSTFVNTVAGILGSYGQTAPMDTFTETAGAQHPTDLAMLRGARLVTATETEDGRRWAAAKIKVLTGGDRIAARFMRQDFFEFVPQFTLIISGNHKPGLRAVDEAMRRRMHLIPFTQTIPAHERDTGLPKALQAEWPAILQWMIDGCLEWQRTGLNPPAAVSAATEDYLADEDVLGQWLDEATEREHGSFETTSNLHRDYRDWAESTGEKFLGVKRFSQALVDRGLVRDRRAAGKGFTGRRLSDLGARPWSRSKQTGLPGL